MAELEIKQKMEEERKDTSEIDINHCGTLIPGAEIGRIKQGLTLLVNETHRSQDSGVSGGHI